MSTWTTTTLPGGVNITCQPYKVPEMPESMKEAVPQDILDAAAAISNSPINWPINALTGMMSQNPNLKDWEIKLLEEAFRSFLAKYDSPLAKALK